ncbi:MAG TPA: radical SAM protein, partial [Blastocatellia bacterium]|nr:radical SAM protein [Blastocatellia bacterium]
MEEYLYTSPLAAIVEKVMAGERLSFDDGVALYRSNDLLTLGYLANYVREKKNGNAAYYIINRHINPTNVCFVDCQLCAFARKVGEDGGWTMSIEEVVQTAARGYTDAVKEFHIVGGLHPYLPFQYYVDLLRALKYHFPGVHLKAFTCVEIDYLAKLAGKSLHETIEILKDAGLDSVPGGGAEIFAKRVRDIICTHKIS